MNISAVSGGSGYAYSPLKQDNAVRALEKQKTLLVEQREKVKQSDMDTKLKQETLSALDDQIADIEQQISAKKLEKLQTSSQGDSKTASSADSSNLETDRKGTPERTNDSVDSKNMISAASGYDQLKTMGRVRTDLKGQLQLATSSGENPEAGAGLQAKIDQLEGDMWQKSDEIRADLKEAAEEVRNTGTVHESSEEKQNVDQAGDVPEGDDSTTKPDSQDEKQDQEILPPGSYLDELV